MFLLHYPYPFLCTLVAGALCVFFELRDRPRVAGALKLLASAGFVVAAALSPLASSSYGHRIVAGTVAGWLGDGLLVGRGIYALACGMALFLLGHVCYMQAMLLWGFGRMELASYFVVMLALVSIIKAWLWPHVPKVLQPATLMYMVGIALMVAATLACVPSHPRPLFALFGAVLFFVSDIIVARDRFVRRLKWHTVVGLPLYWLAQWCLVSTMGVS